MDSQIFHMHTNNITLKVTVSVDAQVKQNLMLPQVFNLSSHSVFSSVSNMDIYASDSDGAFSIIYTS